MSKLPNKIHIHGQVFKLAGDRKIVFHIDSAGVVSASGDTFHVKDTLKQYGLITWHSMSKSWNGRPSREQLDKLMRLLDHNHYLCQLTGEENLSKLTHNKPSTSKTITLIMVDDNIYGKRSRLAGDTFRIKDELKKMGYKWHNDRREWAGKVPPYIIMDFFKELGIDYAKKIEPWPWPNELDSWEKPKAEEPDPPSEEPVKPKDPLLMSPLLNKARELGKAAYHKKITIPVRDDALNKLIRENVSEQKNKDALVDAWIGGLREEKAKSAQQPLPEPPPKPTPARPAPATKPNPKGGPASTHVVRKVKTFW